MEIIRSAKEMSAWSQARRAEGSRTGFVPTMGSLHAGHTSLMDLARPRCDHLVVSIYVNPLQFGPAEDLGRYPRDPAGDEARCVAHGVDILFMPASLYPPGFRTRVRVEGLSRRLCGTSRPEHFEGVTTVVARLFGLVGPSLAVFGDKDYQQYLIIRRMVEDLSMGVQILAGPLVREPDGLALSSRNRYLSPQERRRALSLSRALFAMRDDPSRDVAELLAVGRSHLQVDALDYLEVVHPDTLEPLSQVQHQSCVSSRGIEREHNNITHPK